MTGARPRAQREREREERNEKNRNERNERKGAWTGERARESITSECDRKDRR